MTASDTGQKRSGKMKSKKVTTLLLIFYLAALTWIIVFKMAFSAEQLPRLRSVNLIPFGESVIVNGKPAFGEIIQNMLAFVPYGVLLHVLCNKKPLLQQFLPIFCTSLLFEVIQYLFSVGASDITDIIMNSAGGLLGLGIATGLERLSEKHWVQIVNVLSLIGAVVLGTLVVILIVVNQMWI